MSWQLTLNLLQPRSSVWRQASGSGPRYPRMGPNLPVSTKCPFDAKPQEEAPQARGVYQQVESARRDESPNVSSRRL